MKAKNKKMVDDIKAHLPKQEYSFDETPK